ncbi:MAG: hypothetical protein KGL53_10565 [Elusimicrobia bacterium]|nr:hypothetical protein [Elusimicrobiota bacterium]
MDDGSPLAGPAREVPLSARLQFLFGGFLNQFGWFFLGFGLVFVRIFGGAADLSAVTAFHGRLETAPAALSVVRRTGFSANKRRVFAFDYSFQEDGETYHGTSFSQDDRLSGPVTAEFPAGHPSLSRLRGMRRKPFGPGALFVVIFPVIGLVILAFGLRKALRGIRLLRRGMLATGRQSGMAPTNTTVNGRVVYELTYAFKTASGEERTVKARSERPEGFDEAAEPVVYDPVDRDNAMLLDDLPGRPRLDEDSVTRTTSGATLAGVLAVPAFFTVVHLVWWLLAR